MRPRVARMAGIFIGAVPGASVANRWRGAHLHRVLAGMPRFVRYWFTLVDAVDRRAYLATGLGLMAFKYAVDAGAVALATGRFWSPLDYLLPFYLLRAEKLALCRLPTVPLSPREGHAGGRTVDARPALVLYGIAAGLAVALPTVLLNVYVLRRYSTSLFLGTPFTLGAVTADVFNRAAPQGPGATAQVVSLSLVLLAGAMLVFALEGLVCVTLALPLALALAIVGGIFGRAIALHTPGRAGHLASLVLAAPLLAGLDEARGSSPTPQYQMEDSVVVAAPRAVVWRKVESFSELASPTEALFRLGVAYPRRARIVGVGAGAIRYCEFSTGTFVEPITEWAAPGRLSFDITAQPVPLRELSPYGAIAPPHLHGYFRARRGAFRLTALSGGRTLLVGATWYELDIEPRRYWKVPADAIVSAIHRRVLAHIKRLSEAGS